MTALIDAVIDDFQLYIATPTERVNLRMSVRTTLRNLRSAGLAESRMGVDHLGRPMTYWFWRQATTLDGLRALVASQAEAQRRSASLASTPTLAAASAEGFCEELWRSAGGGSWHRGRALHDADQDEV